jgi:hypothetical protein
MKVLIIIAIALLLFLAANAIVGYIVYQRFAIPNMRKLSEEELALCKKVVESRKGYPWLCKRGVKSGTCACQPCQKWLAFKYKNE